LLKFQLRSIHCIETTGILKVVQPQRMDSIKNCSSFGIPSRTLHVSVLARNQYFLLNIGHTECWGDVSYYYVRYGASQRSGPAAQRMTTDQKIPGSNPGKVENGRAIAQAVSRWLPTVAARVQTRVLSCGILWWIKVALGQVFAENFGFPRQSTFHILLLNHLHYHPRLAQYAALPIASQTQ
jgi:hypothetical protein